MRLCHDGFVLDDRLARFDFERVHGWLSGSYWSPGISRVEVEHGFRRSSFVAGAYAGALQVGCLRVVSDFTRFAYFLDVFVAPEMRRRGLAQSLVRFTLARPDLALVYKWTLATRDAHAVYARLGFESLPEPRRWLALERPRAWLVEASGKP